jgi:hypothetical protein
MTNQPDSSQPSAGESGEVVERPHGLGRWQFSLRELMLFVALVAMGLSLFVTARRYLWAEAEVARLQREYGVLVVQDPAMFQAVAQWTPERDCWRWRVHLPPGKYDVCYETSELPADGFPKYHGAFLDIPGGADVSVLAGICKDPGDNTLKFAVEVDGRKSWSQLPTGILDAQMSDESGVLWGQSPVVESPDKPLMLLRHRLGKKGKNGAMTVSSSELHDGLMLWITRTADATGRPPARGDK